MDVRRWKGSANVASAVVGLAVALTVLTVGSNANASFPGTNGNIAYIGPALPGNIFIVNPAGGVPQQITNAGAFLTLNFNATGSQLVGSTGGSLVTLAPTAGAAQTVVPNSSGADTEPSFNPAGTALTFDTGGDIFRMDLTGANRTNLTNTASTEDDPDWSADGTFIAYEQESPPFGIQRIAATGGALIQVNPAGTCVALADRNNVSISPSNNFVSYDHGATAPTGIFQSLSSGASVAEQRLSNGADVDPAYAPTGDRVAYIRAAAAALTTSPSDGSQTSSTLVPTGANRPSWSTGGGVTPTGSPTAAPTPTPTPRVIAIASAPNAGGKTECVFPVTVSPAGAASATVTVSGSTANLDGAPPATVTVPAAGNTTLTVNVKSKKKKGVITATLSAPSGASLGAASGTCTIKKKHRR
jgi:WD40 repeat protein